MKQKSRCLRRRGQTDEFPIHQRSKNQKKKNGMNEERKKEKVLQLSTIMYIPLRLCVYNIKWLMIEVLHENINTPRFVIVLVIVNVTPFKVSPSNAHKSCQLINNSNVFCSLFHSHTMQKGKLNILSGIRLIIQF